MSVRDRLIALSPAHDAELPKIERGEPVAFTVDDVMRLAEVIVPRYRPLILVGVFGGLRIGELGGLQLGDFDPLRSLIRVRRTASGVGGKVIVSQPKTSKSIRTVALPQSAPGNSWTASPLWTTKDPQLGSSRLPRVGV